jgi:hypothetical protein
VRNIILDTSRESRSLFDYVDPFSDIDCVVDRREDWISLSSALASSLPYAGFYRWEAQTLEYIKKQKRKYPALPSERVIVWFDGSVETAKTFAELEMERPLDDLGSTFLD